jgi:hypothetical protein
MAMSNFTHGLIERRIVVVQTVGVCEGVHIRVVFRNDSIQPWHAERSRFSASRRRALMAERDGESRVHEGERSRAGMNVKGLCEAIAPTQRGASRMASTSRFKNNVDVNAFTYGDRLHQHNAGVRSIHE